MTDAFAEFERSIIRQRVHAGLKRAVEQGKRLGRSRTSTVVELRIERLLRKAVSIAQTARKCQVGHGTVQRIKAELLIACPRALLTSNIARLGDVFVRNR